ncbi:hypothetical protein QYF36_024148 [Acer negundo]|nr:hypothetical protein QYF36_024148 [Acer negundo]
MASTSWLAAASEKDDFKFKSPYLLLHQKKIPICAISSVLKRKLSLGNSPCRNCKAKSTSLQRKLAYYKSSDEAWTRIDTWYGAVSDFTFYNGKLYAIDYIGRIMSCDIKGNNPTIGQLVTTLPGEVVHNILVKLYIVESSESDTLLVISRQGTGALLIDEEAEEERYTYGAYAFQVFKVDLSRNTWMEIKDLGNRAAFLGHYSSFSSEASDFSECKPNCIYFTDD